MDKADDLMGELNYSRFHAVTYLRSSGGMQMKPAGSERGVWLVFRGLDATPCKMHGALREKRTNCL